MEDKEENQKLSTFDRLMKDPNRKKRFEEGYKKFIESELNDYEIIGDIELPEEENKAYMKMIEQAEKEIN